MHLILFILYLVFFCWVLLRIKFITSSGLKHSTIIVLFLMNVFVGVLYGWINKYFLGSADTWYYFAESLKETELLFKNPHEYLTNIFQNNYSNGLEGLLDTKNSFWNDLKLNLIIKLLSVFNLFSFNNYYVNIIFYNFFIFFAPVALYKFFTGYFTEAKKAVLIGCFFIPSTVFFVSGLHKDGLIYLGTSLTIYFFNHLFINKHLNIKNIVALVGGLLIMALFRNFFLLAILPALTSWYIAFRIKKYPLLIFIGSYILCLIFFFNIHNLFPSVNLLQKVCNRQHEFNTMSWARSYISTSALQPNFLSFAIYMPTALNTALLRPYIYDCYNFFYVASSVEIIVSLGIFILFLFFRIKTQGAVKIIALFCFFFCFTVFLIIGYTIPIIGAVVRYKSTFLPFIITPMLALINWQRVKSTLHLNI